MREMNIEVYEADMNFKSFSSFPLENVGKRVTIEEQPLQSPLEKDVRCTTLDTNKLHVIVALHYNIN